MSSEVSEREQNGTLASAQNPPKFWRVRSSSAFITAVCSVAIFTDGFLYSVIIPVIPFALTKRVGVPQEDAQKWNSILLACYSGGLILPSLFFGWLADRLPSRRTPFILGLLVLGGSTMLLCFGSSIAVLILGRLLQGFSGAVIWTVVPALLVDTVGRRKIGRAMGWIALSFNLAMVLGPVLGGIVFEWRGYYPVYYMMFAIVLLDVILRLAIIEKKFAAQWGDIASGEKYWLGVSDTLGPPHIEPSSEMLALFASGCLEALGAYDTTMLDRKESSPSHFPGLSVILSKLPILSLLRSARMLAALWGSLVQATILCAFDAVIPFFVDHTFGWYSTGAGLIYLPLVIPYFLGPTVGKFADKYGPKWIASVGFLIALPFLSMLRLITHYSLLQAVLLCLLLLLIGFSMTLIIVTSMAEVTYIVEDKESKNPGIFGKNGAYAQCYGLYYSAWAVGMTIGPMWGGFMMDTVGWQHLTLSLGLLSAVTAIPTMIFTGGLIGRRR